MNSTSCVLIRKKSHTTSLRRVIKITNLEQSPFGEPRKHNHLPRSSNRDFVDHHAKLLRYPCAANDKENLIVRKREKRK